MPVVLFPGSSRDWLANEVAAEEKNAKSVGTHSNLSYQEVRRIANECHALLDYIIDCSFNPSSILWIDVKTKSLDSVAPVSASMGHRCVDCDIDRIRYDLALGDYLAHNERGIAHHD